LAPPSIVNATLGCCASPVWNLWCKESIKTNGKSFSSVCWKASKFFHRKKTS